MSLYQSIRRIHSITNTIQPTDDNNTNNTMTDNSVQHNLTAIRAPSLARNTLTDYSTVPNYTPMNDLISQPERGDIPGKPKSQEAAMYSSRQIAAFQPNKPVATHNTDIQVQSIFYHPVPRLSDYCDPTVIQQQLNLFVRTKISGHATPTYNQLIHDNEYVLLDIVRRSGLKTSAHSFIRAGPRKHIMWESNEVNAAIVTCGGLCPGMNDVISELFTTLYYNYGVDTIYGIRNGLRGFWDGQYMPYIQLTPEKIHGIYELGGTVLGSSRGGFDIDKIMNNLIKHNINQIYIIGGDGTHRAADRIALEAKNRKLKISVIGIPKTIDNDLGVIDRSFGFSTAVTEARKAIQAAVVEASCAPYGIGIVQLMGRHAGYIAAHATLSARQVDICLIPEIQFPMTGDNGVCGLTEYVLRRQGYAVIVVAEGAGSDLVKTAVQYDEGGNKKLPDIGKFMQSEMSQYFKSKKLDVSIKLIDPSYMIRAVPADASDAVYCQSIAQNAVHGAMAGYTGFSSGLVNNRTVLIPFDLISATSPSYLNPDGRTWERVLSLTHQPMWRPSVAEFDHDATKH